MQQMRVAEQVPAIGLLIDTAQMPWSVSTNIYLLSVESVMHTVRYTIVENVRQKSNTLKRRETILYKYMKCGWQIRTTLW